MSPESRALRAHPASAHRVLLGLLSFALLGLAEAPARSQAPPPESLQLRITPDAKNLQRGDLVTFTVEVVNTSDVAILRDGTTGGAALLLSLPDGLGFVPGSGRIELSGGQVVDALDPATSRVNPRLVQDRDGNPLTLNLGPRQALRFRYQLRVAPKATPYTDGEHRAWLASSSGDRLSNDAVARLRIEPDPELDLSVVLGSVYCDADADGQRDPGEAGVGGVRIAGDHGRVVDTDRDGAYHLRDFRPGAHLVKLDVNTLPPGVTPGGDPKKRLDLTGGLLARFDFPMSCPKVEVQRPTELVLREDKAAPPAPVTASNEWVLRGKANDLSAAWEGASLASRAVTLEVEAEAMTSLGRRERTRALNVPWRPGATRSLNFVVGYVGAVPSDPARVTWQLEVAVVDRGQRELVHVMTGQGLPPDKIGWDGLDAEGAVGVLKRGQLHEARLVVIDGPGERLESAPVVLGASWTPTGPSRELAREVSRDRLLTALDEPTKNMGPILVAMKRLLEKNPGSRLIVEVHVGPSGNDENDLVKTRRAAFNIGVFARKEFDLGPDRVMAVGFGRTRPLRPNVSERNKAFNKRIEFVVLPPEDESALPTPPVPTFAPRVHIQGNPVKVDAEGRFLYALTRPEVLALSLEAGSGARRTVVLGLVGPLVPPAPGKALNPAKTDPGVDKDGALVVPPAGDSKSPDESEDPPEASAVETLAADPLRRFGGQPLREALGEGNLVVGGTVETGVVTADELEVELPPRGTELKSPRLFLKGRAHPKNVVTVNGRALHLDRDGRFGELLALPSNIKALEIASRDPNGHVAKLEWPLTVKDTELFLLALVDGVGGQLGARLEELDTYDKTANDTLFLAGRGALYAKGRISGTALAHDLFVTAHIDTTRRHEFSSFFEQVVDPTRDYLIYGDATDDLRDANARGRFYLLVEADRSKVMYGSFRTNIRGLHLLRYDRTFEGAMLDVDTELAKGFRTQVKGHLSDDNRRLVRRHDELRATGGSLYYLSSREIIEGSDKVELVVRELDTGLELGRTALTRDVHYRIDYPSGRVMTMGPISSVVDPLFQVAGTQPFTGRAILDGHEVWLDVDYESRAVKAAGDLAWGVQVRQELFDRVEIGGGYIREGRPAGASGGDPDYVLWGVQARVKLSERSRVYAEYAEGKDKDGATRVSTDGGLGYRDLDRAPDDKEGVAFRTGFDLELGEILKVENLDLRVKAHWQYIDAGYHAVGLASEEGTEKWGGEVTWKPYEAGRVHLRYDGGTTLIEDRDFEDGLRAAVRNRFFGRYDHDLGPATIYGEALFGQHRDDLDGRVIDTGAAAIGTSVRLGRFTLMASQEALFGGDDAIIGDAFSDRLTTNVGVEVKIDEDLALRLGQSVRWNGDNATRFGFTSRVSDGGRVYFEEQVRPGDRNGRLVGATVIGAEHALGREGRIYSEYRLDGGVGGRTNRAVMGLGRSFELSDGVKLKLGYERSQALDNPDRAARGSRDVLSGGLEITGFDRFRFSGLYELRWDRDRPPVDGLAEVLQAMVRNTADLKLGDVTVLALFNYMLSQDLDTRRVAKEDLEASLGLAYRPLANDDLILVARYSRLLDRTATTTASLLGQALRNDEYRQSDLVSVAAIIALPWRLTLTEKLVWRFHSIGSDANALAGLEGEEDLLLWLNRLAFNIWGGLDLAGEFRVLASLTDFAVRKNGGLIELSFDFLEHARVGIGWAIDGHAGGLLPGEDGNDIDNGFFTRLTGTF